MFDARYGRLMPVTCVEVKGTDPSAHAGEQNISIIFILSGGDLNFYPIVYAKDRILKLGHFVENKRIVYAAYNKNARIFLIT